MLSLKKALRRPQKRLEPVPKSVKDVQKFIGFTGYYQRFIKGFSTIVHPLNDLLIGHSTKEPSRKKTPFRWEVEQEQAFRTIIMLPTLKKWGGILVSACPYVCMYVCMYVRMYVCIHVRDIVLKLHVWIPHGKIADTYFWFSLNYLPLSNYGPLTNKGMKFCKCHISKSIIARNLKLVSADRG